MEKTARETPDNMNKFILVPLKKKVKILDIIFCNLVFINKNVQKAMYIIHPYCLTCKLIFSTKYKFIVKLMFNIMTCGTVQDLLQLF